jgi:hypothetical protein
MADQAAVNGGRVRINSPFVEGVVGNLAEFGHDVATLAELQAELALIDLKETTGRAALPAVAVAGAAALGLGAVPIVLFGVAELITLFGGVPLGWSLLIVSGVTLAVAVVVGVLAGRRLARSFASFRRSREELARNISWVKTVLAYSGRPAPPRGGR